jgi:hypothetical protein
MKIFLKEHCLKSWTNFKILNLFKIKKIKKKERKENQKVVEEAISHASLFQG